MVIKAQEGNVGISYMRSYAGRNCTSQIAGFRPRLNRQSLLVHLHTTAYIDGSTSGTRRKSALVKDDEGDVFVVDLALDFTLAALVALQCSFNWIFQFDMVCMHIHDEQAVVSVILT